MIPEDAVWFTPAEFRSMMKGWLNKYDGVKYATEAMDTAHGSWTATAPGS